MAGVGVDGSYFISYSRVDAEDFARRLADQLMAGPPEYPVWLDVQDLQPDGDWDEQIADAIQACRGLLFVMTADSVQARSVSKDEWVWALKYKKPVIPLRAEGGAGLPFRLASRQYIDFSGGFDVGLGRLRTYLGSVGGPKWVLQDLRYQLADAERELPRADPAQRLRVRHDIEDLSKRIAEQEQVVADPQGARRRADERIAAGLEQQRQPERPVVAPARARFVNQPPVAAPPYFQDRHVESELIGQFLRAADERLLTVAGRGGVGKTAMVCRLLKALEGGRLPDDLGELDVDGIVYLSPSGEHPVSFPNLFGGLCRLLPDETARRLRQLYRDPHQAPAALMRALLDAFPSGRVMRAAGQPRRLHRRLDQRFHGHRRALDEALRALLAAPGARGEGNRDYPGGTPRAAAGAPGTAAPPGPGRRAGLAVRRAGAAGQGSRRAARAEDRPRRAAGSGPGADPGVSAGAGGAGGDPGRGPGHLRCRSCWTETAGLPGNVVEALVGEAFNRLDALAQQVMQALAVYPVPVPPVAVDYLLQPYQPAIDAAPVLGRLVNMQFVRREAGRYYLHQVDRDYALSRAG